MRSCTEPYYLHLVMEYLLHLGFQETVSVFKKECNAIGFDVPNHNYTGNSKKNRILKSFDLAQRALFFQNLSALIPDMATQSNHIKKLIADLYVHFTLTELSAYKEVKDLFKISEEYSPANLDVLNRASVSSPQNISDNPAITEFISFLEQCCHQLRTDSDFAPYFSFPSNPLSHHLFCEASQDKWVTSLRARLQNFLEFCLVDKVPDIVLYLPSYLYCQEEANQKLDFIPEPEKKYNFRPNSYLYHKDSHDIVHLDVSDSIERAKDNYRDSDENYKLLFGSKTEDCRQLPPQKIKYSAINKMDSPDEDNPLTYMELKQKFSALHTDYHNLIGVASELTDALESSVRGQTVDLSETLNKCIKIFPELFTGTNSNHQQKSKPKYHERSFSAPVSQLNWKLNIGLIKMHLIEGNMKSRLLLLQALRWAITKSHNEKRECIMRQFVKCDLMNLGGKLILRCLLMPAGLETPHPIQQSAARLLNALTSIQSGRSYLSQNSETVKATSAVLQQQGGYRTDTFTKNMLVAALQKLSLRRDQRIAMIEADMVEWLLEHLSVINFESIYSLEYGTALLMNLLLHESAKDRCVPIASRMISLLIKLLATSNTEALPYIVGAMFSIVAHHKLNETAAELELSKVLENMIVKQQNTDIRRQMEHILQFHQSSRNKQDTSESLNEGEMINNDDEELNLLSEELDEHDPVSGAGELCGDELLKTQYTCLSNGDFTLSSERCPSSVQLQPVTPHLFRLSTTALSEDIGNGTRKIQEYKAKSNWYLRKVKLNHLKGSFEKPWGKSDKQSAELTADSYENPLEEPNNGSKVSKDLLNTSNAWQGAKRKGWVPVSRSLPRISIQMFSKGDTENSDSNKDMDDDSDVLVASVPNSKNPERTPGIKTDKLQNLARVSEENYVMAAAFVTRAKIPRTPPHHF